VTQRKVGHHAAAVADRDLVADAVQEVIVDHVARKRVAQHLARPDGNQHKQGQRHRVDIELGSEVEDPENDE